MGMLKELIEKRPVKEVFSVVDTMSVRESIEVMAEKSVGAIGVVNSKKQLVGVFSERDLSRRVILTGKEPDSTPVGDVMTRDLVVVGLNEKVKSCQEKMYQANIRHLAVVDGANYLGLLSLRDLMRHDMADKEERIKYLTDYMFFVPEDAI